MKLSRIFFVFLCLLLLAAYGCNGLSIDGQSDDSSNIAPKRPNIVFIVIDTLRADHLTQYGSKRDTSPNMTDFSETATLFEKTYSSAPWTLPSFASILMAKHAFNHNAHNVQVDTTNLGGVLLPTLLRESGYKTLSIQTNIFPAKLDIDFDERYYFHNAYTNDKEAISKAIEWLDLNSGSDERFFMFIGLFGPHPPHNLDNGYFKAFYKDKWYDYSPYNNPFEFQLSDLLDYDTAGILNYYDLSEEFQSLLGMPADDPSGYYHDSRLHEAAYDSEISFTDYQVGLLLANLKKNNLFQDSIIVITADHGENMTDHTPYFSHGSGLYNSQLKVPLIIKLPNQTTKEAIATDVRTIDILPTIFDYLDIPINEDVDGNSLIPVINNEDVDYSMRPVVGYLINNNGKQVSVVYDGYKLIKTPQGDELYNIISDPCEKDDISSRYPDLGKKINRYLENFYEY